MTLSTRIGVMDRGRIAQVATPRDLYERPTSTFVANFLGSINLFEGSLLARTDEGVEIALDDPAVTVSLSQDVEAETGTRLFCGVRPEKLTVTRTAPPAPANVLPGLVEEIAYLGDHSIIRVVLDGGRKLDVVKANVDREEEDAITWDERVFVSFSPGAGLVLLS